MSCSSPVLTDIVRSSCGTHLLDHLAADRACLAGGQVAVVAVLQVDADLPWCTPALLKGKRPHAFPTQEEEKCAAHRNAKQALAGRESAVAAANRSTGLPRRGSPGPAVPPALR